MVNKPINKRTLYIFGAGSFARCIEHLVKDTARKRNLNYRFVEKRESHQDEYIISEEVFLKSHSAPFFFNIAIADVRLREKIALQLLALGGEPLDIISDDFIHYRDVKLGVGSVFCARTMATVNITVGDYFHCNIYSYIEHDCVIGNYVTFSPRVSCNGYVNIGDRVFVGAGAIIRNGHFEKPLRIGNSAVVGMGAVVIEDVPDNAIVVGNPARIIGSVEL